MVIPFPGVAPCHIRVVSLTGTVFNHCIPGANKLQAAQSHTQATDKTQKKVKKQVEMMKESIVIKPVAVPSEEKGQIVTCLHLSFMQNQHI